MPDRILTTHVGSLPRNAEVTELIFAQERGDAIDSSRFDELVAVAVDERHAAG